MVFSSNPGPETEQGWIKMVQEFFGGSCTGRLLGAALIVFFIMVGVGACTPNLFNTDSPSEGEPTQTRADAAGFGDCQKVFAAYPASPQIGADIGLEDIDTSRFPASDSLIEIIDSELDQEPNFAGFYRVIETNCDGDTCGLATIVNTTNGQVVAHDLNIYPGVDYRKDSTMLVINPVRTDGGYDAGQHSSRDYYQMQADTLALECIDRPADTPDDVCQERIVNGTSDATGEEKSFTSQCDLPSHNWRAAIEVLPGTLR